MAQTNRVSFWKLLFVLGLGLVAVVYWQISKKQGRHERLQLSLFAQLVQEPRWSAP